VAQTGVYPVNLLVEPPDVGVHGLHLAADLVQRGRDNVLDRALDLIVDPHARHSINLVELGQRPA